MYGVNAGGKVGDDALLYCYIVVIVQAQPVDLLALVQVIGPQFIHTYYS